MSYVLPPQATKAGAPTTSDDNTKGYVIGSAVIDTSVTPRRVYICTSAATGAAIWANAGGISDHDQLTNLGWSAAGHTGTTNSIAAFDASTGAAQTLQATQEGSVLALVGGVLTFTVMAAAISFNVDDLYAYAVDYPPPYGTSFLASSATLVTGTIA